MVHAKLFGVSAAHVNFHFAGFYLRKKNPKNNPHEPFFIYENFHRCGL